MPIYDNNGTNSLEIGTLFDNNGTTNYQIDKVYDNNGTTNSLIYEAENVLYPGRTVYNLAANSGTYDTATFLTQESSGTNQNSITLYIIIDLTNIDSLNITGTFQVSSVAGYSGVWLSSTAQFNSYKDNQLRYPYYDIGQGASSTYYVLMNRINLTTGTVTSYTFNTSSLTGNHYLCIGCYSNHSTGGTLKAQITKVVGVQN